MTTSRLAYAGKTKQEHACFFVTGATKIKQKLQATLYTCKCRIYRSSDPPQDSGTVLSVYHL